MHAVACIVEIGHHGTPVRGELVRVQRVDERSVDAALAEASFRAMIERLADAVLVLHRDLTILYANPAASGLFGFDKSADLLGRALPLLFHSDDSDGLRERLNAILATRAPSPWRELRAERRDGAVVHVDVSGTRVVFGGKPAVLAIVRDLLSVLDDGKSGAQRVRDLVRELHASPRSVDGSQAIDVRPLIDSSVREAQDELQHAVTVIREYEGVPCVEAQELRLSQLFFNLIVNAMQAVRESGRSHREIRIRAAVDGAWVLVSVSDTGTGIAAAHLRRIFEPFFTTKPRGAGTGLGLAICREIVTGRGGEISVSSTPGCGTTFVVRLPRAAAPISS